MNKKNGGNRFRFSTILKAFIWSAFALSRASILQLVVMLVNYGEIPQTMPVPVPIFKLTEAPQFLHRENLIYPENMRSSGITGVVKLAVLIGKEGNVYRVKVLKSAGDEFDEAAKIALLSSTFIPAKMGKKNVAVELRMPVKFRLL